MITPHNEAELSASECYHCGEIIHPTFGPYYPLELNGQIQTFCCHACHAVAEAIIAGGLSQFYQYRNTKPEKPSDAREAFTAYDLDAVQEEFVTAAVVSSKDEGLLFDVRLHIPNISCAACSWLIENYLMKIPSVKRVTVNVSSHQCHILWCKSECKLSNIFSALNSIGYQALPATKNHLMESRKKSNRSLLLRLGVAGIGMMQVGMVAIALYAGDLQGMDNHWRGYLRWVSLLFALPVMAYSAQPFLISAYRALRFKTVNMDVPVSLALCLAFFASIWATIFNTGHVYFDSVSMFVFFLLLGRYLEMRARHGRAAESEDLTELLPITVKKVTGERMEVVPLKSLIVGDIVEVAPGSAFPCDGIVLDGKSSADESMLTGESSLINKLKGDSILAGTTNGPSALRVQVNAVGLRTQLNLIHKMRNMAAEEKPMYQTVANRLSVWFVIAVLLISAINAGVWFWLAPEHAFWVTLSVLVVTCPCALSLATPAALTAGIQRMQGLGLLITSSQFLERLQGITHVVFDKTGTLTTGKLKISQVLLIDSSNKAYTSEFVLQTIAALEAKSTHPVANAFKDVGFKNAASDVNVVQGLGVEGRVGNIHYRFGKSCFVFEDPAVVYPGDGSWQLLATHKAPIAWVLLEDQIKDEAIPLFKYLTRRGKRVSIVSGDRRVNVASVADIIGISDFTAEARPEDKLSYIHQLQKKGASVLMVGDGINDIPILSGADASIAMGSATQLAKASADSILLHNNLYAIAQSIQLAEFVHQKIKQNLMWAIIYNLLALPLAVLGYIPPYLAAVGMSVSSLIVVVNSLSLQTVSFTQPEKSLL